jgi:hypothetical protein
LYYRKRNKAQPNRHSTGATFRTDIRSHPLQGRRAAGVQPQPFPSALVDSDRHKHPTTPDFERQDLSSSLSGSLLQETHALVLVINLDYPVVKEIGPDNAIHCCVDTDLAEPVQIEHEITLRKLESSGACVDGLRPKACFRGANALHSDSPATLHAQALCSGSIYLHSFLLNHALPSTENRAIPMLLSMFTP